MAKEYTYVRNGAANSEVKNMYVWNGSAPVLVKIAKDGTGNVVHRAQYDVTYTTGTGISVNESPSIAGRHGTTLVYNVSATDVDKLDQGNTTTPWGSGTFQQVGTAAEWTFTTPTITSGGNIHFAAVAPFVSIFPAITTTVPLDEGDDYTFSPTVNYNFGTLSYQWYRSINGGSTWSAISGATNQNYVIYDVPSSFDNYRYKCTVTVTFGSESSNDTTGDYVLDVTPFVHTGSFTWVSTSSVNEGGTVNYTFTTNRYPVYFRPESTLGTINSSDFTAGYGASRSSGTSYSVTLANDATTEGTEKFRVKMYADASFTQLLATSAEVTINDTSLTPPSGPYVTSRTITSTDDRANPSSTSAIQFGNNGVLQRYLTYNGSGSWSIISGQWLPSGTPSNYTVRATVTAQGGNGSLTGPTLGVDHNLGTTRIWYFDTADSPNSYPYRTLAITIKEGGTTVETATITLAASHETLM
jgi:hypothetical protein